MDSAEQKKKTTSLVKKALKRRTKSGVDKNFSNQGMSPEEVSSVIATIKREQGDPLKKARNLLKMKLHKENSKNNDSHEAQKVTQSQLVKTDHSSLQSPKEKLEQAQQKLNDLKARMQRLSEKGVKRSREDMAPADPLKKIAYGNAQPGMAANDPAVMPTGGGIINSIERGARNFVNDPVGSIKGWFGMSEQEQKEALAKGIGGPSEPPIPDSVIDPKHDPRREPQDTYAQHKAHSDEQHSRNGQPEELAEFNDEAGPFHVLVATHPDHHSMIGAHHRVDQMVSRDQSTWPNSVMEAIDEARNHGFDRLIIHQPEQQHAMEDKRQKIIANNGSQKTPLRVVKSEGEDHEAKAHEHLEKAKYYHKMMKASRLPSVASEWQKKKDFHMAKCSEYMAKCMPMQKAEGQEEQALEKAKEVMTVDHVGNKESKPKKTVQPQETSPIEDRERNEMFKKQQEKNYKVLGESLKQDAIEVVKQNKGRDPGTGVSSAPAKKNTKNLDKFKAGEQINAAPEGKVVK